MWIVVSSVLSFFRVISNTYLCRGCSCNSDHRLQLGHFPACPSLLPHHCIQQTFVICFLWKTRRGDEVQKVFVQESVQEKIIWNRLWEHRFSVPYPRIFPPPGGRFSAQTTENRIYDWACGQPSNMASHFNHRRNKPHVHHKTHLHTINVHNTRPVSHCQSGFFDHWSVHLFLNHLFASQTL